MTTAPAHEERGWVVLLVGLFIIVTGYPMIVIAMVTWWGLAVVLGALLLVMAWRARPPLGARILSRIVGTLGAVGVLAGIYALAGGIG